jgi:beta-glucosidase
MNTSLSPEQRADMLIAHMTLEQKVEQISNDTRPAENPANRPPGCEFTRIGRHIQGIPELGIPTVRMINGGTGVRGGDCANEPIATGVPSTSAAAATFNPELNLMLGQVLGNEARLDGHQVMLAPAMNLHRIPYGGRNYEYYSEDPYLSGVMAVQAIEGIQSQGVQANPKHFAANEQETQRRQMATVVPPRALHELYLLPFEMSVKEAQPASIMCAFPEINGTSACSSMDLLKTTLREDWGFGGWVMTDRRALHDTVPSIKAGVDWELAHITPLFYSLEPQKGQRGNPGGEGLKVDLANGKITVSDINQMVRRRYVQMFKLGQFDTNFDALYGSKPDFQAHNQVAREIAEQAVVLLKNQNNFLPLNPKNIKSIALIGASWFAGEAKLPPRSIRGDNVNVIAPFTVTPQQGLQNVLEGMGSSATVTYNSGAGTKSDRQAAIDLAKKSDVVIVMLGDNPHELCDRETLGFPQIPPADPNFCAWDEIAPGEEDPMLIGKGPVSTATPGLKRDSTGQFILPQPPATNEGTKQERLMSELIAAPGVAQKMVVVLKTEGMVLMPWLNQVPALVEAWYPGQDDGNVVADILFGIRNPSGKLPMTFGNSPDEAAYATTAQFPGLWTNPPWWLKRKRLSAQYTEGLQMGYRWYEANHVTPVFPFGFGLSYTTFAYSGLSITPTLDPQTNHTVLSVTYTITNTGKREGAEASQVYVTLPAIASEPSKRLVGFQKVDLQPGEDKEVTVTIDPSAPNHPLSYWVPDNDAPVAGWANGTWTAAPGDYTIHVGTSSAETPLQQTVSFSPIDASSKCQTPQPQAGFVCVDGNWVQGPISEGEASGGVTSNEPGEPE